MKIQNTQMEFVTFDAKDVIATSNLIALGSCIKAYNESNNPDLGNKTGKTGINVGDTTYYVYTPGEFDGSTPGYIAYEGRSSIKYAIESSNKTGDKAYIIADSTDDILNWVTKYLKVAQQ